MNTYDLAPTLATLAATGETVTVKRTDGKEFVGRLASTGEPMIYKILTGRRGRPALVHAFDVESVSVDVTVPVEI